MSTSIRSNTVLTSIELGIVIMGNLSMGGAF